MPDLPKLLTGKFLQENPDFQSQAHYYADEDRWRLELPAFKEFALWCAVKGFTSFEVALQLNLDMDRIARELPSGNEGRPPVI